MAKVNGAAPQNLVTLTRGRGDQQAIGDLLAVDFTQKANSPFWWALDIDASTTGGRFRVGSCIVRPPSYQGQNQGQQPGLVASRRVAYAWAPGAIGWRVNVRLLFVPVLLPPVTARDAVGEVNLASSANGGALSEPGVVQVDAFGRGATFSEKEWRDGVELWTGAPVLLTPLSGAPPTPLPGYVWDLYGETQGLAAGTQRWLQVHDRFVAPVAGDIPKWSHVMVAGALGSRAGRFPRGIHCTRGPWVAVSDNGPTFVPSAAGEAWWTAEWETTPRLAVNP